MLDVLFRQMQKTEPFERLAEAVRNGGEIPVRNASGSLSAFALAQAAASCDGPLVVVCPDDDRAESLRDDLERILPPERVCRFPAWDVSMYDGRSPHLDVMGERLEALSALAAGSASVVVAPVGAVMGHTLTPDLLDLCTVTLQVGADHPPVQLGDHLVEIGYERVVTVEGPGQFSVRGGIVDVCSFGNPEPVRVEFFGDEVTSLRSFDLGSQRSTGALETARLLPCREAVMAVTMGDDFDASLEAAEGALEIPLTILRETLQSRGMFDGAEHYLGVLYGSGSSESPAQTGFLDHLPSSALLAVDDPAGVAVEAEALWARAQRASERQEPRRDETEPLPYHAVLRSPDDTLKLLERPTRLLLLSLGGRPDEGVDLGGKSGRRYEGHLESFREDVLELWKADQKVLLLCESRGQQARFSELLDAEEGMVSIEIGTLHAGFTYAPGRVAVVNDHEIYSRVRRRYRGKKFKDSAPIASVNALQVGDFVVHVDHGIARYSGIERLTVDSLTRDCLKLSYRGDDRVFVPVDQMDRVQKYSSQEGATPVLNKLGTATWERVKSRTRKEIFKMASELVTLYAERKSREGTAFSPDSHLHNVLDASFPFQETRDQLQAIADVKADMEHPSPMDRLICGDVGYGKTEVAIRAAFKAVADGKQVAILAPTTILAQQHYRTFSERMEGLPVSVDVLSRFRTKAEQSEVVEKAKLGKVDIVIGTHRLVSKDVEFHDLGLLVIDEEHRFGVRHKDRLKQVKRMVDVLTLTATPMPRTLHLPLMAARDMSIIKTPPKDRLPIYTEVLPFDEDRMAEAILREVERGGQVYFVHNRVRSMPAMVEFLEDLLPQVRIVTAHGQMPERQLEKVMLSFLEGNYDCLLSTMIIESGLDIPSVNTLIVNRADRLGLAQLYQLRGRVGRSSKQAYAYLFIPSRKALSRASVRRLRAIEEHTDLGSGFDISMRDMEIRGAGNLLGVQQHGHISAVGFDLYCRLLDEAVLELKGEVDTSRPDPDVQVTASTFIPEDYVEDPDLKMSFYQRLAQSRQTVDVLAIEEEMEDRFGAMPDSVASLLDVIQVRILARQLGVSSLREGVTLTLIFPQDRVLTRKEVERMVSKSPLELQFFLGEEARVEVLLDGNGPRERLESAKKVMQSLV